MTSSKEQDKADAMSRMFNDLWNARSALPPVESEGLARFFKFIANKHHTSQSQIFQDLLVLYALNEKRDGFFIEFGAADGVSLSNTFLLEKSYGWSGIVAEPAHCWQESLKANRKCAIDLRYVWSETGKTLEFNETADASLSTAKEFLNRDFHSSERIGAQTYCVETISINDLARAHNAPAEIDYLSLDTEGSELQILQSFDFQKYKVKVITVEHNFTKPDRDVIFTLLLSKGYVRVFPFFSAWDDWYVHKAVFR